MENHLIIGLGGTGGKVLKAFRKRLFSEYSEQERAKLSIGFVYVDSTTEMMNPDDVTFRVHGKNAAFTNNEFVNIRGIDLDAVFRNPNGYPGLNGIIGDPEVMQKTIGSIGAAAGQKRRAGRILFAVSVQSYIATLTAQYDRVKNISGNAPVNIHIITGLAGGTGSGAIIDVIAQTRNLFPLKMDAAKTHGANILVYCMTPEVMPPPNCEAGRYHANGYAALMELNAQMAGKYQPHDVMAHTDKINNIGANGIFVYTNVNEHGAIIESFEHLPSIVSDLLYSYVFLEQNGTTEEFLRAYNFENIDDHKNEYSEKVQIDKKIDKKIDIVRSKTFGSFGVKRVIVPEEEIIEYFTYNFGKQALLQMRYNNWNDDSGFRDRPANIDFNSYVRENEQLEHWRLTDKHLILDKPVLNSDFNKWGSFADYWNNVIPVWTKQAESENLSLTSLEIYCEAGYEKFFRKVGVPNFFERKTQAKEEHANEITDIIERAIFDKWSIGDLSLYNLTQLIDKIIESVGQKRKDFYGRISTINQILEQLDAARTENSLDWAKGSIVFGKKKRTLQKHSELMLQIYLKRTELRGLDFGIILLATLITKLNALRTRVETFVSTVNRVIDDAEKQIGARCQDNGAIVNLQDPVIRFYNREAVRRFTNEIVLDKVRQENIAGEFRQRLIERIGNEHTFTCANAEISSYTISQIMETFVREKAIVIHDEILVEENEKLINRNIMEQLSEKYSSEDDLRKFARELIQRSGVLLTFDHTEISRAVRNNPIPQNGVNIFKRTVLINLPKIEGNENVQMFAGRLRIALEAAVHGNINVKVDANGTRKNEITIISLTYCFPLRAIYDLKKLKEKCDYLVNNANEAQAQINRTVLHTEGIGENFPNLFVENDLLPSQIRDRYTAYLIIARAMDFIKYADRGDGTGKYAYGIVVKNRLGIEVFNPLADLFTEIPYKELFNETFGKSLKKQTGEALKTKYLHVTEREKLQIKVGAVYADPICLEFNGNMGTEDGRFFTAKAEEAIEIIDKA
jgi:hypothetical protein